MDFDTRVAGNTHKHELNDFEYWCPTRAVFGRGGLDKLSELIPDRYSRVMLLYGGGSIKRNGVYERVQKQLGGRLLCEFGGIEANPDYDTCMKAVAVIKEKRPDFLLAVGGGSVVDATKFITCAAGWTKTDCYEMLTTWCGDRAVPEFEPCALLPLGCVVTLPATGTEMNDSGVISCRRLCTKTSFAHHTCFPVFAVLDPEVTYSLPRRQVANGLADTFVHVMEQYAGHFDMGRVQDEQCEALLRTVVDVAPHALVLDPPSYKARADFFWCATQGLNYLPACGIVECWATHKIGHELTAFYGLDHGVTLAIVLPRLLSKLIGVRKQKLAQMAERVWKIPRGSKTDMEMAQECIERCESWFRSLGIATTLSGNGCDGSHIKEIAERFRNRKIGAEKLLGEEEVYEILSKSL